MMFPQEKPSEAYAETLSPALPDDIIAAAMAVLETASQAEIGIATAESCTGGLLASLLTDIEGTSNAFDRGFVVYSKDAKCDLLGLSHKFVEDYSAVSEPVARAMAEGALRRSKARLAIAITGFAGPGASDDEPGLVHFACAAHGADTRHSVHHFGDIGRGATRIECLRVALAMLSEMFAEVVADPQQVA
ncbi:CinA family protein [Sphingobium sp. B11D3A]|uniref:CinA family protein n=1 Tax=Sphingobium sp. B11D3A TaxID=2940574 RepID=UPI00222548B4|nr:CinA family protein [Sphingobium sp. B11D3A]MCW2390673.1 nicotinamide-nucleotide amidase [Sphingobium sp. B11D3A]